MIKCIVKSSPTHLLIPIPFHSSEQENMWAGHPPASLSFLSHWTLLFKAISSGITLFWACRNDSPWFPYVIIPCKIFISHYIYSSYTLEFLVAACIWIKWLIFQRCSVHRSSQGNTWREQLIQVWKTMDYLLIQKTIASLEKKTRPFISQVQMLPVFSFISTLSPSIINTMYSSLGTLHSWWYSIFKVKKILLIYGKTEKDITRSSSPVTWVKQAFNLWYFNGFPANILQDLCTIRQTLGLSRVKPWRR